MFARIRQATDDNTAQFVLRGDWDDAVNHVARTVNEQAPIDGFAGMSEGGTVGSILLALHMRGDVDFGAGFRARMMLSVCALTSPAHAYLYAEEQLSIAASLHMAGDADMDDVHHTSGRTAALFGPASSVLRFGGGHKLPLLSDSLRRAMSEWSLYADGQVLNDTLFATRTWATFEPLCAVLSASTLEVSVSDLWASAGPRCSTTACRSAMQPRPSAKIMQTLQWQSEGVLRIVSCTVLSIAQTLADVQSEAKCHSIVLSCGEAGCCVGSEYVNALR